MADTAIPIVSTFDCKRQRVEPKMVVFSPEQSEKIIAGCSETIGQHVTIAREESPRSAFVYALKVTE